MNILIVDDEAAIRDGIETRILRYGHTCGEIYKAGQAQQALEIMDRHPIDLAFVDINMPFMNGLEMIERYKGRDIAFVVVSGYDSFSYAQKAIELGVVRYLLKPIRPDEFRKIMNEMTERFQKRHEHEQYGPTTARIMACIRENLSNPGFSLTACAQLLGLSESAVSKTLRRDAETGFSELLSVRRVELGEQLIRRSGGRIRIGDLASQCGFTSSQYFSVVFRKHTGMTPTEYRAEIVGRDAKNGE